MWIKRVASVAAPVVGAFLAVFLIVGVAFYGLASVDDQWNKPITKITLGPDGKQIVDTSCYYTYHNYNHAFSKDTQMRWEFCSTGDGVTTS